MRKAVWIAAAVAFLSAAVTAHAESVKCCGGKSTATISCSPGWSATCACDASTACTGAGSSGTEHAAECSCGQIVGAGAYDGKWHLDGMSYVLESAAGAVRIPASDATETAGKNLEIKSTADAKGERHGKTTPAAASKKLENPSSPGDLSCHRTCCPSGDCQTACCLFDSTAHAECKDGKAAIRCSAM